MATRRNSSAGARRRDGKVSARMSAMPGMSRGRFLRTTGMAAAGVGAAAVGLGGVARAGQQPSNVVTVDNTMSLVQIQGIVDQGGEILFKAGTYQQFGIGENSGNIVLGQTGNDVKIRGEKDKNGNHLTIFKGGQNTVAAGFTGKNINLAPPNANPIYIPGTYWWNDPTPQKAYVEVHDIHFENSYAVSVGIVGCTGAKVSGCKFTQPLPDAGDQGAPHPFGIGVFIGRGPPLPVINFAMRSAFGLPPIDMDNGAEGHIEISDNEYYGNGYISTDPNDPNLGTGAVEWHGVYMSGGTNAYTTNYGITAEIVYKDNYAENQAIASICSFVGSPGNKRFENNVFKLGPFGGAGIYVNTDFPFGSFWNYTPPGEVVVIERNTVSTNSPIGSAYKPAAIGVYNVGGASVQKNKLTVFGTIGLSMALTNSSVVFGNNIGGSGEMGVWLEGCSDNILKANNLTGFNPTNQLGLVAQIIDWYNPEDNTPTISENNLWIGNSHNINEYAMVNNTITGLEPIAGALKRFNKPEFVWQQESMLTPPQ